MYFKYLFKYKWLVLICNLVLIIAISSGAQFLYFNDDYRIFFDEDNQQIQEYEAVQNSFNKTDNVFIVLKPTNGVFNREFLSSLEKLTKDSWQIPYSTRVDSLSNYQHIWVQEDDLIVENLIEDSLNLTQKRLNKIKDIALKEPLLVGQLISSNAKVTAVNITINIPKEKSQTGILEVATSVREMVQNYKNIYPNVQVHLSGVVMFNNAFAESNQKDLSTLLPMLFLAILLMLGFLLKTITGVLGTLVVIISSIIVAFGGAGWFGLYISGPSIISLYMILTLAVADCVHILTTYFEQLKKGKDKIPAMKESLSINFSAILLTSLTTAIGFLALNFSDVGPFNDLGNIVAFGVMIAFIFSVTLFPILMVILPVRVKKQNSEKSNYMLRLANFTITEHKKIFWSLGIPSLLVSLALFLNVLNDEFVKYFDPSISFRQAADFSDKELGGNGVFELSLKTNKENGINDPKFLRQADKLTVWLREQKEVRHVSSLTDTVKKLNYSLNQADKNYYSIPQNSDLTAQYILLYELSLPYGLDLNNQLNVDKSATRVVITTTSMDSRQNIEFENRINRWIKQNITSFQAKPVGTTLMFSYIGQTNIYQSLISSALALILISFLLIFALRSFKYGFLSFVPNLLPIGVTFGFWGLIVGQIGIANSIVASLALGIIVDDTVHFLSKYLYAIRERKLSVEDAIRFAFTNVGKALWITTLALVIGFMIMAQSSYLPNADMGLMVCMTLIIALLLDLLLLPAIIIITNKNKIQELKI